MTSNIEFMRQLEDGFRKVSALRNRSQYKIFYGQVFPAPILTLGMNPGGDPDGTSEDGTRQPDGSPASASPSYFEHMENDVIDCEWRENLGLRKLLMPLVGHDAERFRQEVVKTNIAFRRSRAVGDIRLATAAHEAAPFLGRIIDRVRPTVIILTGSILDRFLHLHASTVRQIARPLRLDNAPAFAFAAAHVRLKWGSWETIVVQVAHASRFAWTYDRLGIPNEIAQLVGLSYLNRDYDAGVATTPKRSSTPSENPGSMAPQRNEALARLESKWLSLGIAQEFHRVHHFSDPKFSGKRETLKGFIKWCDGRDIQGENAQTVQRALDVVTRVEASHTFDDALYGAWAAFPVVTRLRTH